MLTLLLLLMLLLLALMLPLAMPALLALALALASFRVLDGGDGGGGGGGFSSLGTVPRACLESFLAAMCASSAWFIIWRRVKVVV